LKEIWTRGTAPLETEDGLQGTERFDIDPRRVVHETIDGEAILIQLETGTYYSLRGCGPEIWTMLAAGWCVDETVAEMQRRYPADAQQVADATAGLVRDLVHESLLLAVPAGANGRPSGSPPWEAPGQAFEAPELQKYTDMEYFLLLDPIHEVDQAGWPHERADAAPEDAPAV
jgi:coenzyme PQQ synthesis protein D (PqqD)